MLQQLDTPGADLRSALKTAEHQRVLDAIRKSGIGVEAWVAELGRVTEAPHTQRRLLAMRDLLRRTGIEAGAFERAALVAAAARSLEQLDDKPVPPRVKRQVMEIFDRFGSGSFDLAGGKDRFVQFAKMASLRRWPAGLFDFELSGLPRRWVPKIRPVSALARTLSLVTRWRGFKPLFFAHLTICRPVRALLKRDAEKSYHLIARSIEMQPQVHAFVTSSWFHSPDTFHFSPHLAWLNDVFLENGAIVARMGRAEPDCGVLSRSPERERAYREGRFKPTLGLVIWPRERMIEWADSRSEYESV